MRDLVLHILRTCVNNQRISGTVGKQGNDAPWRVKARKRTGQEVEGGPGKKRESVEGWGRKTWKRKGRILEVKEVVFWPKLCAEKNEVFEKSGCVEVMGCSV